MRSNMKWFFAGVVVLALTASPFALAAGEVRALFGGERNPSNNPALSLREETEVIATTSTYGTRQSNKSDNGGGAIYGCRSRAGGSPANNEPCVRASNLANGRAFEFSTGGTEVGRIESSNNAAAPFTTNAAGVATCLNADRVDSKSASEITSDAAAAANRFAVVSSAGVLGANRGATAAANPAGAGTYTVTFSGNISACALSATAASNAAGVGAVTAVLAADNSTVEVLTRDDTGAGADFPFHLTVTC
jgi:hypothetical protein